MRENHAQRANALERHRWIRSGIPPFPPELEMLGFDDPPQAIPLNEHEHPDAFEFVVIEKGHASWEIGRERFQTRAGEVFHTRPGEAHRGTYEVIEPCRLWWILIRAPTPDEFAQTPCTTWMSIPHDEAAWLIARLWNLPRVQPCGPLIVLPLKRLRENADRSEFLARLECRAAVLDFLVRLLQPKVEGAIPHDLLATLASVMRHMHTSPGWRPKIPDLAASMGVSVSHFHRIFRAYSGMSPMDYMERIRIEEACHRLDTTNDSILQIALDLGYATSQHFATVFRRIIGQTPTHWRRRS